MKNKKHIDELFKDRFKNFEATPSPQVWENIQSELQNKKKDRKVIPLWWKVGGVAALLALLLTVGNSLFIDSNNIEDAVVTSEEVKTPDNNDSTNFKTENKIESVESNSTTEAIASEEPEVTTPDSKTTTTEAIRHEQEKILKSSNRITKNTTDSENAVAVQNNSTETSEKATVTTNKLIKSESSLGVIEKDKIAVSKTPMKTDSENTVNKNSEVLPSNNQKVNPLIKEGLDATKAEAVTISSEAKTKKEDPSTEGVSEENKKSIQDAINEQEALKTEDAVAKKELPEDRWDVAPNFAPVYYNSLSQGSSLDPTFADNSQNGDVNISYGVQVSYNLSKRLSIRTGVSNVDLSYSTGGVELGTGPVSAALKTIDYGGKSVVLTAVDQGTFQEQMNNNPDGGFGPITPKSSTGAAEISQNIQYYEVPLELKYALLDTKFGVNLIGGLSTLFLGDNEVSVMADGFRSTLGEANNLSSVSFSTNIGLGLDYKISRRLKFNVEPMFKYQLNPYTESSVDFQPYYIGVYTGFSLKF
tara:strand:+ start:2003 stop:3592 length:1590 start_codon:yes stop_codon:yes gene_type:complete